MTTPFFKNKEYDISVLLMNAEGYYISIIKESVLDIQIEDSLTRWWVRGYIDIDNKNDFLEKPVQAIGQVTDVDNINAQSFNVNDGKHESAYSFRNDGNDMLVIKIQPKDAENDIGYTILYVLNVHGVTDIGNEGDPMAKGKRLIFRDEKYHDLLHSNLDWSTADLSEESPIHAPDSARSVTTGKAIKYLLTKVLGENTAFDPYWDNGGTSIFYTSPANYKCINDLDYLLSAHVSDPKAGNCKCFLSFDRGKRFWRLIPLTTIFKHAAYFDEQDKTYKAGALQSERFELLNKPGGSESSETEKTKDERVPSGGDKVYQNYNLEDSSIIKSLKFYEMNGADNLEFLNTTPVHLHDKKNKRFTIKQTENSVGSIYKKATSVVSNMIKDKTEPTSISMNIHPSRRYNTNINHAMSLGVPSDVSYLNYGINTNVLKGILLSNAVEFRVPGETPRQSGKFISIQAQHGDSSPDTSIYDDKVYGQYFVTSVVHRITRGDYTNKIVGVKPYNYRAVHTDTTVKKPENFDSYMISEPEAPKSVQEFFEQPVE